MQNATLRLHRALREVVLTSHKGAGEGGLDLLAVARVEVTSEDPAHPVEFAFAPGPGWRAAGPGRR